MHNRTPIQRAMRSINRTLMHLASDNTGPKPNEFMAPFYFFAVIFICTTCLFLYLFAIIASVLWVSVLGFYAAFLSIKKAFKSATNRVSSFIHKEAH